MIDNKITSKGKNNLDNPLGAFTYIIVFIILYFYFPEPDAAVKRAVEAYPELTYIFYGIPICLIIIYKYKYKL
jgi:hypothetical protein